MRVILFLLFFSLTGCAYISGVNEAKNTPPAPIETNSSATSVTPPTNQQAPTNTNSPSVRAAKALSPATF